jgi:hypothetical protein
MTKTRSGRSGSAPPRGARPGDLNPPARPGDLNPPARRACVGSDGRDAPTGYGFRYNFSRKYPQDLKMVWKDAPCDSLQSAQKNQVLILKIEKVTVILRRK